MGKRRKNRLPPFVAVFKEMLQSQAWEKIGNPARVAYIHLKGKCCSASVEEISLSFNEMEKFMHRHTFAKAIRELEEFGFVKVIQKGGLYRRRNFYLLSEEWKTK